jgi:hypothetical protein
MLGPVDFKKTMDFWEEDKWNAFFPITWHIIKDIPNHLFKHIVLENNNNRIVTFSRDTQEVHIFWFIFLSFPYILFCSQMMRLFSSRYITVHLY